MTSPEEQRFEAFFRDPLYLLYKNHLYNYLNRRWVIRRLFKGKKARPTLELGCGISPMLKESVEIVRTDLSWKALAYLRRFSKKGLDSPLVACEATRLPFLGESFQQIVCSEVLEHVREDGKALEEVYRVLQKGGEFVLTCPIHSRYFGFDDTFVGHYRRYEVGPLKAELSKKGLGNFQVLPVLGPLEKQIMEPVTKIFARFGNQRKKIALLGFIAHALAWVLFPLYFVLNYLLAWGVRFQAQRVPQEKVTTICIQCQKIK